jgi:hypothetical protein
MIGDVMTTAGPIFVPIHASLLKPGDVGEFLREAKAFRAMHGGVIHRFDNKVSPERRRVAILEGLTEGPSVTPVRSVAFFCHGLSKSIQAGFDLDSVGVLARAIHAICTPDVVVSLYACSTATGMSRQAPGGDGGFADKLRDNLVEAGARHCRVIAHYTAGHTTRNPHVRYFEGPGNLGGVAPFENTKKTKQEWRRWVGALKGELRLRFPFMTIDELRREVLAE